MLQEALNITAQIITILVGLHILLNIESMKKFGTQLLKSKEFLYTWRGLILIGFFIISFLAFLSGTLKVLEGELIIGSLTFASILFCGTGWAYCNWQLSKP
jgi:hypothetical protein